MLGEILTINPQLYGVLGSSPQVGGYTLERALICVRYRFQYQRAATRFEPVAWSIGIGHRGTVPEPADDWNGVTGSRACQLSHVTIGDRDYC